MTDGDFILDPRLAAESALIGELPLCRVLLFDDARFPWIVLVPRRAGLVEIIDMAASDLARLMEETAMAAGVLEAATSPHKLNVASLGNIIRQLHMHIVARFEHDAAWPGPVWGRGDRKLYEPGARAELVQQLRKGFGFS